MPVEIERKYLVDSSMIPFPSEHYRMTQGYLSIEPVVRVRKVEKFPCGERHGLLSIKGPGLIDRAEFEYEIPFSEAKDMFLLTKNELSKTRYYVEHREHTWHVDEFHGSLKGLWLAEIELKSENEKFVQPSWVVREVTMDQRYSNAWLADHGIPLDYVPTQGQ